MISARYVDTCYPDYLSDSYSREGQTLLFAPLGLSCEATAEVLLDSLDWDAGVPDELGDTELLDAIADAIKHVDLRPVDPDGNRTDYDDPKACSSWSDVPNVYVVLEWEISDGE